MEQLLLVEGIDDFSTLEKIFQQYRISDVAAYNCKGLPKLFEGLPVRIKNNRPFGIVIDANTDINGRWRTIIEILEREGYTDLPDQPYENGTVLNQPLLPSIGIWLMPDNQTSGMLEDFLIRIIPQDDNLLTFAQETLSEIENRQLTRYRRQHRSKALIHTWLAWQQEPGLSFKLAIGQDYFITNHELVTQFLNWINTLFSQPIP